MSRFSVFAAAAVLSALATIPVAFAKEHHHVLKVPQSVSIDRSQPRLGWAYAGPRPPVHYGDAPSYDDPSKFGGGEALPVTH
ncbi:hypothetical protein [Bradyrhizobium sp. LeoA1S1]